MFRRYAKDIQVDVSDPEVKKVHSVPSRLRKVYWQDSLQECQVGWDWNDWSVQCCDGNWHWRSDVCSNVIVEYGL